MVKRMLTLLALALLLSAPPPARAACQEVRISGPVQDVRCVLGRCSGYVWTGNGARATRVLVRGWGWHEGQVVSKTLFICGM